MRFGSRPYPSAKLAVAAALFASILVRGALCATASGSSGDPDNYLPLAHSLAAGHGLAWKGRPTAYRPPLYPLVLAPIVAALGARAGAGVAVLHGVLGGATVAAIVLAARRWGLSGGRVAVAAWIVALDPALAWQSRFVMTETLAAFLTAAAIAVLSGPGWRGWLPGGIVLGLAGLARRACWPGPPW